MIEIINNFFIFLGYTISWVGIGMLGLFIIDKITRQPEEVEVFDKSDFLLAGILMPLIVIFALISVVSIPFTYKSRIYKELDRIDKNLTKLEKMLKKVKWKGKN